MLEYLLPRRVSITLASAAAAASPPTTTKALNLPPKRPSSQSSSSALDSSIDHSNALGLSTSAQDKGEAAFWAQTPGGGQLKGAQASKKGVAGSGGAKGWATGLSLSAGGGAGKGAGGLDLKLYAKMLEPYRVSLSSLGKKDEYQVSPFWFSFRLRVGSSLRCLSRELPLSSSLRRADLLLAPFRSFSSTSRSP